MSAPNGTWKNWVVGIVGVLIAAGVLASIGTNMKVAGSLGRLEAKVETLTKTVSEMQSEQWRRAASRYTKGDAERDFDRMDVRVRDLERKG